MIYSYTRGHRTFINGEKEYYLDTGELATYQRPCVKCGQSPTKDGFDACLGKIEGARAACCGHGVSKAYVIMNDGSEHKLERK